ncbi:MAG: FAD-binding protein [Nanoarchaeota archaeon]|nr:FAD-binding protein [Nanoarchaeota archaeon]
MYDIIIIGAGPAGLFAAYELSKKNKKILIIERGSDIEKRKDILSGIGGSGLYSDGKLNLSPIHGKTNLHEFLTKKQAKLLVNYIDEIFINFGAPKEYYSKNPKKEKELRKKAKKHGIDLLLIKQKHLGSDKLKPLIKKFVKKLKQNKVKFLLNTEVKDLLIKNNKVIGVKIIKSENSDFGISEKTKPFLCTNKKIIKSEYVIACPGRSGASWFLNQAKKLDIPIKHRGIEIGIRIEIPAEIMKPITDIVWDPAFFIKVEKTHDIVRTFCTCPNGFVTEENYHGFMCVNGYCRLDKKSKNTNFALLSNVELTHPTENTIKYGASIGLVATTIAGGKPFIQSLKDFKKHRRSYWRRINKSKIKPTLKNVTPGDLTMALPHRIVYNLNCALKKLNKLIPSLTKDALLYGPELKFFSVKIKTNKNLETKIKNLFVAGDGVGLAGNIIGATATGIIAARGILNKNLK